MVAALNAEEFFGEGCMAGQPRRMVTASAMTDCKVVRLEKTAIIRVLHDEPRFSEFFIAYLLARTLRVEEDLIDQLFNSSEKRLARALLLLANFGKERAARVGDRESDSGDAGRNDRYDAFPCEFLHEQIQKVGIHQLQRPCGGAQLVVECRSARPAAQICRPKVAASHAMRGIPALQAPDGPRPTLTRAIWTRPFGPTCPLFHFLHCRDRRLQKRIESLFDDCVALARGLFETAPIENLYFPPTITNKASRLHGLGRKCHRLAIGAQYVRQKLVGVHQGFAFRRSCIIRSHRHIRSSVVCMALQATVCWT